MRDTMLILHFIGLVMGLGTGFAYAFLGKTLSKMNSAEAKIFRHQIKGLGQMGMVGSILLFISGIYLIIPFWPVITTFPLLILKLVLFLILEIFIVIMNQAAVKNLKNDTENHLKRIEIMGKFTLILGVTIVVIAVNIFH